MTEYPAYIDALMNLLDSISWTPRFVTGSMGIVAYVFEALSLYTVGKRRGIQRPWLAWVPIANVWTLGEISDHYQQNVMGKQTKRRKIMLGLNIATVVLTVALLMLACVLILRMFLDSQPYELPETGEEALAELLILGAGALAIGSVVLLPVIALAIVLLVFRWKALWDVFRSCDEKNGKMYFVLGLLLSIFAVSGIESIFLFLCREKDEGMRPCIQTEEE